MSGRSRGRPGTRNLPKLGGMFKDETWPDRAACKKQGHVMFAPFAERPAARAEREAAAKALCDACPVFEQCAAFIEAHPPAGGWWANRSFEPAEGRKQYKHRKAVPSP